MINCKIDTIQDGVYALIRDGIHTNQTIDFSNDFHDLSHIDMKRAYANFWMCSAYKGFVGKITDWTLVPPISIPAVMTIFPKISSCHWPKVTKMRILRTKVRKNPSNPAEGFL